MKTFLKVLLICGTLWISGVNNLRADSGSFVDLTVFHVNDLHSQLHPPQGDPFKLGGLARLATLIKNLKSSAGLSITLDAGDWSEGTWYYNLDSGANMLTLMEEMGMEASVVGNHDYLAGPDRLLDALMRAHPRFPVLAANVDVTNYKRSDEFLKFVPASAIIEKDGIKIGLIGLTCWGGIFDFFAKPLEIKEPILATKKLANELRPNVDFLIAISHNYLPLNVLLARAVPQLDAVISGHLHKKTVRAEIVESKGRKIPIVEAGDWGTFVGELRLRLDRTKKQVSYVSNRLHPVLPLLDEDPLIARRVVEEDQRLKDLLGSDPHEIVAESEIDLDDQVAYQAGLGDLVTKSYRAVSGADVAFEVMPLIGIPISAGPVTVKDIHDVLPHLWDPIQKKEWTVKKLKVTGKDLLKILRLQHVPDALPIKRSGFIAFDNLDVTWKPKRGNFGIPKVVKVLVGGKPLDLKMEYTIALTEGTALSFQLLSKKFHLGFEFGTIEDTGVEAWRAILKYAQNLGKITEDVLSMGRKTLTVGADPSVYQNGIRYHQAEQILSINIVNQGLAVAQELKVKCSSGMVNDSVVFKTKAQVYSMIGEAPVPELISEKEFTAKIPWSASRGSWPIRCEVTGDGDAYPANSQAERVIVVE